MNRLIMDRLRTFAADQRGSLTIEFVIWVPVLAFWMVFSIVMFDAYTNQNRATKAAYTISDILSRETEALDSARLEQLYALQDRLLPRAGPYRALRITNIRCNIDPDAPEDGCDFEILWSVRRAEAGMEGYEAIDDPADLPLAMIPLMRDRDELLLVDLGVHFQPVAGVGIDARWWDVRVITRTRYITGLDLSPELAAGT